MQRSSSYYLSSAASSSSSSLASGGDAEQLPTYDPQSEASKKDALDASRANLVPVVVLLCDLLLWSFSTTTTSSSSEVGGIMENKTMGNRPTSVYRFGKHWIHTKLVTWAKSRSTDNMNRSEMFSGMDGVDPTGKNKDVTKPR
uniref:Uncharacterized protein n=1 Tax=Oryza brachyantha TaxID=4533 RepID=J3L1T6_ORYBR